LRSVCNEEIGSKRLTKESLKFKYSVDVTNSFKKDFVDCYKRGLDTDLLVRAVEILATDGILPQEYNPHQLRGNYQGFMEMPHSTKLASCMETRR